MRMKNEKDLLRNEKEKPIYEQQGVAMTCRSYEEYVRMFALEADVLLKGPILDVAAGASSFVAEASAKGLYAIAVDPLYALAPDEIEIKGIEEIETSTKKLEALQQHMDWTFYGDLAKHRKRRERSLETFLHDYRQTRNIVKKRESDRYVPASLPQLPFADDQFAIVFCSHFLFLYGEHFDYEFHRSAVHELIRVCHRGGEVRIYPLKTLSFGLYPKLSELLSECSDRNVSARFANTQLPFIPGSTDMLILTKQ